MAKQRLVNVNGSGGAFVDVFATMAIRGMEIIEDDSVAAAQGLDYKVADDGTAGGFTTVLDVAPAHEPIVLGNSIAKQNNAGPIIGYPAQVTAGKNIPATKMISLRSKTVTPTVVRITEIE